MATRSMPIVSWRDVFDRDLDLGADTVGRRDQDRVVEARSLEVEQAAEAANLGVRASACGSAHQRLDQFHHAVAGIDIDTGSRVARLFHGPTNRQITLPAAGEGYSAPPTSESPGAQARGTAI